MVGSSDTCITMSWQKEDDQEADNGGGNGHCLIFTFLLLSSFL